MSDNGITPTAHFNPPMSPTFGERLLMEADVPKTHLSDQSGVVVHLKIKKSVALLPVRYAVSDSASKAYDVSRSSRFKVQDCDGKAMPFKGDTHYTLRRLRYGYLHIYSEVDRDWFHFLIRPVNGKEHAPYGIEAVRIPSKYLPIPGLPTGEALKDALQQSLSFAESHLSSRPGSPISFTTGGVLVLPEDYPIWLAFSDAMWTDQVKKNFEKPETRAKHMRRFDPSKWESGWSDGEHIAPLTEAKQRVADLLGRWQEKKFVSTMNKEAFWFSQDAFDPSQAETFEKCHSAGKPGPDGTWVPNRPGAILALDDPSGMVMDLATFMLGRYEVWLNQKDPVHKDHPVRRRQLAASFICQIHEMIENDARYFILNSRKSDQLTLQIAKENAQDLKRLGIKTADDYYRDVEKHLADSNVENRISGKGKAMWARYAKCVDEEAAIQWHDAIKPYAQTYNTRMIVPLEEMWRAWFQSQRMLAAFQHHFDTQVPESGLVYAKVVERCIAGIQDKSQCAALVLPWLSGDPMDHSNFVLRALLLNQDKLAENLKSAINSGAEMPWESLFAIFQKEFDRANNGHRDVLIRMLGQLMSIIAYELNMPASKTCMALLGVLSGKPAATVTLKGTRKAFLRAMWKTTLQGAEGSVSGLSVRDMIDAETEHFRLKGEKLDTPMEIRCVVPLDPETIPGLPKGTATEQIAWAEAHLVSPEQFAELPVWKNALFSAKAAASKWTSPFLLNPIASYYAFSNMMKMKESLEKSTADETLKNRIKFHSSWVAFAGSVTGTIGAALKCMPAKMLERRVLPNLGRGMALRTAAFAGEVFGEVTTGVTGMVMAAVDVRTYFQEREKGHKLLAYMYLGSAAITFVSSALFFMSFLGGLAILKVGSFAAATAAGGFGGWLAGGAAAFTGWGLLLVAAGMLVAAFIAEYQNNPIQDWMERCIFHGKLTPGEITPKYYKSISEEWPDLMAIAGAH